MVCVYVGPWYTYGVNGANHTNHPGTQNHVFLCGGIGEWMWKHEVGLTSTAPAFAGVRVAPKVHNKFGPSSAAGTFYSPRGAIRSAWELTGDGHVVTLNVSLPIGAHLSTVTVVLSILLWFSHFLTLSDDETLVANARGQRCHYPGAEAIRV